MYLLAIPLGALVTVGAGTFGVKYYFERSADSWALDANVSIRHTVRVGIFKTFFYDDVKNQLVIYQPLKEPIFIPYDVVAGYQLVPTGKSTAGFSVNTADKNRPLIKLSVARSAIEIINARMIAHMPHLQRIA